MWMVSILMPSNSWRLVEPYLRSLNLCSRGVCSNPPFETGLRQRASRALGRSMAALGLTGRKKEQGNAPIPYLVRRRLDGPHSRGGPAGGGRIGARCGPGGQGRWGLDLRWRGPTPTVEHCGDRRDDLRRPRTGDKGGHRRVLDHRGLLREEALVWAARIAQACRCAQEV